MPPSAFDARAIVDALRRGYESGHTKTYTYRIQALTRLLDGLHKEGASLSAAVNEDFGKPDFEVRMMEMNIIKAEVHYMLRNLKKLMENRPAEKDFLNIFNKLYVRPEPKGVVLIFGCWNYPLQESLSCIVPAIAAGNTILLKPSEIAPRTSEAIARFVASYCDENYIKCVQGNLENPNDYSIATEILKQEFDHILYTGSVRIAKVIMEAAAKHMTPVTLECGGKSPCIIDCDRKDLQASVNRILWGLMNKFGCNLLTYYEDLEGKVVNGGQTCIAPDYILVRDDLHDEMVSLMRTTLAEWYPNGMANSEDYTRIAHMAAFNRFRNLIEGIGADRIVFGGEMNGETRRIALTIVSEATESDAIMREEMFGPILPVMKWTNFEDVCAIINRVDAHPLSLYLFTPNVAHRDHLLSNVTSGGVCVNDVFLQAACLTLPFGGVRSSGIGRYHGSHGFDEFSHMRAVCEATLINEPLMSIRYPPYRERDAELVERIARIENTSWTWLPKILLDLYLTAIMLWGRFR